MSNYVTGSAVGLYNPITGALVGLLGNDGKEYLLPVSSAYAGNAQASPAYPGNFTTLTASGAVSGTGMSNYMASPPAIGTTAPGVVKTSNLQASFTDSSGTPGNVTNNSPRGRAAFAAGTNAVTVTSTLVTAASTVLVILETADGTLTQILTATPAAGSFTVTGNANATGTPKFSFQVVN